MAAFGVRFLCLLLATALAGCCFSNTCDCDDEHENDLYLRFQTSATGSGLTPVDVDTVYVLRYAFPLTRAHDSVALVRPNSAANDLIVIGNNAPFKAQNGYRVNDFRYVVFVQLPGPKVARPRHTFTLSAIQLQGKFEGDGCCTCYRNTYKVASLNGAPPRPVGRDNPVVLE